MAYAPPTVGPAGLTIPSYQDILTYLLTQFQTIYGQNVAVDSSSPDYQLISIFALALSDGFQAMQQDFNSRSPSFAIGAALDSIIKLNGLVRKGATFSTCLATITGTPGTEIVNGIVEDSVFGQQWALPSDIIIPGGGSVIVLCTCLTAGAFPLSVGTLTIIVTPTAGWTSVTNATASTPGVAAETDAQLRARQAVSTELPSVTTLAGTIAEISAVPGVTRLNVVENQTNSVDANGNPPHSITAVVEGGDPTGVAIAKAIFNNRGIGCLTNGNITINVSDPNTGEITAISFDRPTYLTIYVTANVHLLTGGTSGTLTLIGTAILNYLNSLQIGERISYGALIATAMAAVNTNLSQPIAVVESLFLAQTPTPTSTADILPGFNQVSQGVEPNIIVNSV